MTREEVKTRVQKLLAAKLPNDIDPKILYQGTPRKQDPEKLVLTKDLRLTVMDLRELAQDISEEFNIHFPIDEGENAATVGDLVDAVFQHIQPRVRAMIKPFTTMAFPTTRRGKKKPTRARTPQRRTTRRSPRRKKR